MLTDGTQIYFVVVSQLRDLCGYPGSLARLWLVEIRAVGLFCETNRIPKSDSFSGSMKMTDPPVEQAALLGRLSHGGRPIPAGVNEIWL
jgi:hypothetical protein